MTMRDPLPKDHPLRRLFSGTVHQVLYVDVGICDPQIADYLEELLASLIHVDDFYPFKDASGKRLRNLAETVAEAQLPEHVSRRQRERAIHRHIGDFALFWAGVFPEGLRRLTHAGLGARISDYVDQGRRSYAIASDLTTLPDDRPPAGVLRRLSERFEYCVYGLNLCRKEWDTLGESFGPQCAP
jgi:hypothetical protein